MTSPSERVTYGTCPTCFALVDAEFAEQHKDWHLLALTDAPRDEPGLAERVAAWDEGAEFACRFEPWRTESVKRFNPYRALLDGDA